MKASDIVGKTVARVDQRRTHRDDSGCYVCYAVERIWFTDGSTLSFMCQETGYDYCVEAVYSPATAVAKG